MGEMSKQYKVLGLNPQGISVLYGVVLIVFAVLVSVVSESKSLTSYIPAFLGTPILTFGLLSILIPAKVRLFMHFNVLIGIFVLLGGLSVLGSVFSGTLITENTLSWANISRLFMIFTGAAYVTICVKSFIFVRKQREINYSSHV